MARAPWLALVLVVLMHVLGCSHGPVAFSSWRTDTLTAAGIASPAQPAEAAGQDFARSGSCDGRGHGAQQCTGVDEPVLARADGGKCPLPLSALPVADARPRVPALRGPPAQEAVHPGGAPRAVLQVWRN
ncbi:hypothetical protein [Streptomyces nodosus]|uniref:hypothetical protein n=1 Tax=Streptomyces nodosus TaxID=40318 RepID=UPI003811E18D